MQTTLAMTALLMGLVGGPHCAAMCGPACGGVVRLAGRIRTAAPRPRHPAAALLLFQAGRLASYTLAGAVAGQTVQGFGWLVGQTAALRPAWTLFHLAVLAWGLGLLVLARQPVWVSAAGRRLWARVRPLAGRHGSAFWAGGLWALMPCGLLYSALVVASLTGGAAGGALAMALFAGGSGLSLIGVPALLGWLGRGGPGRRGDVGIRASGVVLVVAATGSLGADAVHRVAAWCGLG